MTEPIRLPIAILQRAYCLFKMIPVNHNKKKSTNRFNNQMTSKYKVNLYPPFNTSQFDSDKDRNDLSEVYRTSFLKVVIFCMLPRKSFRRYERKMSLNMDATDTSNIWF